MNKAKSGVVYLVTHQMSGRKYVGATTQKIEQRWKHHLRCAAKAERQYNDMHRDIAADGPTAFVVEVIARADGWRRLLDLESEWVARLGTQAPAGYNVTGGGPGLRGFRHKAETRLKIGRAHIGMKRPRAGVEAGAEKRRGRKITPEASAAISRPVVAEGVAYPSLQAAAAAIGLSMATVSRRIASGKPGYEPIGEVRTRRKRTQQQRERMREARGMRVMAGGVEYRSMSAAGAALGLTRPAVAYRIAAGYPGYARL